MLGFTGRSKRLHHRAHGAHEGKANSSNSFFFVCSVCSVFQALPLSAFPISRLQHTAQTPATALLSFALVETAQQGELCWNF